MIRSMTSSTLPFGVSLRELSRLCLMAFLVWMKSEMCLSRLLFEGDAGSMASCVMLLWPRIGSSIRDVDLTLLRLTLLPFELLRTRMLLLYTWLLVF